jgi:hypothetical protein
MTLTTLFGDISMMFRNPAVVIFLTMLLLPSCKTSQEASSSIKEQKASSAAMGNEKTFINFLKDKGQHPSYESFVSLFQESQNEYSFYYVEKSGGSLRKINGDLPVNFSLPVNLFDDSGNPLTRYYIQKSESNTPVVLMMEFSFDVAAHLATINLTEIGFGAQGIGADSLETSEWAHDKILEKATRQDKIVLNFSERETEELAKDLAASVAQLKRFFEGFKEPESEAGSIYLANDEDLSKSILVASAAISGSVIMAAASGLRTAITGEQNWEHLQEYLGHATAATVGGTMVLAVFSEALTQIGVSNSESDAMDSWAEILRDDR